MFDALHAHFNRKTDLTMEWKFDERPQLKGT